MDQRKGGWVLMKEDGWRGWLERMADIGFDYTKSLGENAREAKESRGPSGARS